MGSREGSTEDDFRAGDQPSNPSSWLVIAALMPACSQGSIPPMSKETPPRRPSPTHSPWFCSFPLCSAAHPVCAHALLPCGPANLQSPVLCESLLFELFFSVPSASFPNYSHFCSSSARLVNPLIYSSPDMISLPCSSRVAGSLFLPI